LTFSSVRGDSVGRAGHSGADSATTEENTMAQVAKFIEVSASSNKSFEDAIAGGVKKVSTSVKNIRGAWINEQKVVCGPDGAVTEWRVNMRVSFVVE
jgi:flavin-binding protein dodecin